MSYLTCGMVTMAGSLPPGWEGMYANLTHRNLAYQDRCEVDIFAESVQTIKSTDSLVTFLQVLVIDPALCPSPHVIILQCGTLNLISILS